MEYNEIQKIELKVKDFLGIKKLPDYEIKINKSSKGRIAFNKNVGGEYIITISQNNLSGVRHEFIHLALKNFSYSDLKINLPVPEKYKKDNMKTKFMEYLTICLEIKMGNPEKIKKNLNNYQKHGFSRIKEFYNIIKETNLNQSLIKVIITKANSF